MKIKKEGWICLREMGGRRLVGIIVGKRILLGGNIN
jgi:hypothetical protein